MCYWAVTVGGGGGGDVDLSRWCPPPYRVVPGTSPAIVARTWKVFQIRTRGSLAMYGRTAPADLEPLRGLWLGLGLG